MAVRVGTEAGGSLKLASSTYSTGPGWVGKHHRLDFCPPLLFWSMSLPLTHKVAVEVAMLVCTVLSIGWYAGYGDWFRGQHLTRAKANGLLSLRLGHELWAVEAIFFFFF